MKNPTSDALLIQCVKCGKTEEQVPLVVLRFKGLPCHICPQCFPQLIHKPANLADIFPGLEKIESPDHEH